MKLQPSPMPLFHTMRLRTLAKRAHARSFATIAVAGVMSEGAAGTIAEGVMNLQCTIDPAAIKQKDGSGATCTFDTGQ